MRESRNIWNGWRTTELCREIISVCHCSWRLAVLLWFSLHIQTAGFTARCSSFCQNTHTHTHPHPSYFLKSRRNVQLSRNGQCSSMPIYLGFASWSASRIRECETASITLNCGEKKVALFCTYWLPFLSWWRPCWEIFFTSAFLIGEQLSFSESLPQTELLCINLCKLLCNFRHLFWHQI